MSSKAVPLRTAKERIAELYGLYAADASRLAYLLTGDKELAEDLVQEAFEKILGRFADLRRPEAFRAYLRRTVVNLSRQHRRRIAVERRYGAKQKAAHSDEGVPFPDVATSDAVWNAVRALPARQRTAIVLRFYEDLSEHQTADLLGCSAGAVKSLVARAMQSLRATSVVEGSDGI